MRSLYVFEKSIHLWRHAESANDPKGPGRDILNDHKHYCACMKMSLE